MDRVHFGSAVATGSAFRSRSRGTGLKRIRRSPVSRYSTLHEELNRAVLGSFCVFPKLERLGTLWNIIRRQLRLSPAR